LRQTRPEPTLAGLPLLLLLLLLPASALAAGYPEPKRDFSADVTMQLSDGSGREQYTSRGKEYYSQGKRRREMSMMGRESIHIERPDKGVRWTLIPSMQTYFEHRAGAGSEGEESVPDPMSAPDVEIEKIGRERINGVEAEKYRVRMKDGSGTAWMTAENIPVRFEGEMQADGRQMKIRLDYENIRPGPQEASLFEVPAGYRGVGGLSMPMMGVPSGGGADAPSEEEVEAYKGRMQDAMEQLRRQMQGLGGAPSGGR
jgi:hypothetical protein